MNINKALLALALGHALAACEKEKQMKTFIILYKAEDTPQVFQYTCQARDAEEAAELFLDVADTDESLIQVIEVV